MISAADLEYVYIRVQYMQLGNKFIDRTTID